MVRFKERMHSNNAAKTIFVGLSGGVDSSVSALRLLKQGYNVVGVFIKVWHPDFLVCDEEKDRLDAMRVAAHLKIPFLTFDAKDAYKRDVADYMIAEYKAGRTPNPDVMCNKYVKFGAFLEFAKEQGADGVATGHYAQVEKRNGSFHMYRGLDEGKDQSYFLWTLTQEQLAFTLFPIGNTKKEDVRNEAAKASLPTAQKKDSQGICFLGHVDIEEFLSHYVETREGSVLTEHGERIGFHNGALFYTLGQRHGFTLTSDDTARTPYYVVAKDLTTNTLTVSKEPRTTKTSDTLELHDLHEIAAFKDTDGLSAQFRYRQTPFPVTVETGVDGRVIVNPLTAVDMPSSGQSCVVYRGNECLGGGIVR